MTYIRRSFPTACEIRVLLVNPQCCPSFGSQASATRKKAARLRKKEGDVSEAFTFPGIQSRWFRGTQPNVLRTRFGWPPDHRFWLWSCLTHLTYRCLSRSVGLKKVGSQSGQYLRLRLRQYCANVSWSTRKRKEHEILRDSREHVSQVHGLIVRKLLRDLYSRPLTRILVFAAKKFRCSVNRGTELFVC